MSLNPRYKLVLRPEFPQFDGVRTLNGLPEQPYVDQSGNIDMCGNYLLVKNIEAGTERFTDKGVINVFSDFTSASQNACINYKHDPITTTPGNNRRTYCNFNNGNFNQGSIISNNGGNTVLYTSISDRRVKTDISYSEDLSNNYWSDKIKLLKPNTYRFDNTIIGNSDSDTTLYEGFIANEVQEICPQAVIGTSGETISITTTTGVQTIPKYQYLDMSKLIPLIVGSMKEQLTDISNIKQKINDAINNSGIINGNQLT